MLASSWIDSWYRVCRPKFIAYNQTFGLFAMSCGGSLGRIWVNKVSVDFSYSIMCDMLEIVVNQEPSRKTTIWWREQYPSDRLPEFWEDIEFSLISCEIYRAEINNIIYARNEGLRADNNIPDMTRIYCRSSAQDPTILRRNGYTAHLVWYEIYQPTDLTTKEEGCKSFKVDTGVVVWHV